MDFADRFPVINGDTEPIPPFGIMEVNGVQTSTGAFTVTRPSEDGLTNVLFNGSTAIAVGALGSAHQRFPCVVAYVTDDYTGDDPVEGEIWGTAANSWYLTRAKAGFQILGGASSGRANIIPMPATWTQFVKLTSTTIDATSGCYPATRYIRDVEAKTWTSAGTVWFFDPVTPTNATTGMYIPSFYLGVFNAQEVWGAATWSSGGGGGSITLQRDDGTQSQSSITTVQVGPWQAVTVTSPSAGVGRFVYSYADNVTPGLLSLSAQVMGDGNKTFQKSILCTYNPASSTELLDINGVLSAYKGVFTSGGFPFNADCVLVCPKTNSITTIPYYNLVVGGHTSPGAILVEGAGTGGKLIFSYDDKDYSGNSFLTVAPGISPTGCNYVVQFTSNTGSNYQFQYVFVPAGGSYLQIESGANFAVSSKHGVTTTAGASDLEVTGGIITQVPAKGWLGYNDSTGKFISLTGSTSQVAGFDGSGEPALVSLPSGGGTVTTFSAGNLSPLFTASVANATTTPALTFALSNAAATTIFGNNSGSLGAPAYNSATTYSDAILNVSSTGFVKRTGANTYTIDNTSYGTGTVTSVSVVTANGVSGSVANATTTPSITLTLGAITPSSVNSLTITTSTGTLTIVNLKTFTVNNTLTLSGTDGSTLNIGGGGTLGTAAYTASTAYISSTLMTTLGDIIYEDATPTPARLAGNTTTTKKFLTQTGTGTISAVPGWNTIVGGDLPNSGVSAATYYLANPTFDATGRATACTNASVISLRDEETSGTDGGTATSGAWRTRTLNTKVGDANSNCTLASNQFTLTAGTYVIWASAPAFNVNRHQIRLRNTTDSTTICSGSSEYNSSNQTRSIIDGYVFTIAASKALEIQHQVAVTSNTNGFGVASGGFFTVANEVYTQVTLIRIG